MVLRDAINSSISVTLEDRPDDLEGGPLPIYYHCCHPHHFFTPTLNSMHVLEGIMIGGGQWEGNC